MELSLVGKNALVGGSSKGIGKAAAIELAELGANVTLLARSLALMEEVIQELDQSKGQQHQFLQVDFQDSASLKEKITTIAASKPIHILVNNTGGPPGGAIINAEIKAFVQAFHNHLICNHILTQAVVDGMKSEAYGRIINVISTSVKAPIDGLGVSNTTRGAVASWAKTMANELGPFGITVNNVLPGFTRTGRLQEVIENTAKKNQISESEVVSQWEKSTPARRFAEPKEVAAAIAFLATPSAAYINGINLPVDGGRTKSL